MRILFVAPSVVGTGRLASFQQADVDILTDLGHEVQVLPWEGRPVLRLLRGARSADLVYAWNISDHAFLASFVAQRLVCVVGGYEFANIPECAYGNLISRRMRFVTRHVWRAADALLYVDPSLEAEATKAFGGAGRAHYIPTGYDPDFWTPDAARREDLVVTVAHVPTPERVRLKGVDLFLQAAEANPDLEFHVVGSLPPGMAAGAFGGNVVADGWLDREALRALYRRAKVYCQLSLHEGLPNAVCEAMLCGCVPVGTRVNGIPRAVGDAGILVDRDPSSIQDGIRRAIVADDLRSRAREHIVRTFPLERRRRELGQLLEALGGPPREPRVHPPSRER